MCFCEEDECNTALATGLGAVVGGLGGGTPAPTAPVVTPVTAGTLRPVQDVLFYFWPLEVAAAADGKADVAAIFTALNAQAGGETVFEALAQARVPPRTRSGLGGAGHTSAATDLRKIASYVDGTPPSDSHMTWVAMVSDWEAAGRVDAAGCVERLEGLLQEAQEWQVAKAAAPAVGRLSLADLPFGAASDLSKTLVPAPTDQKAKPADMEARVVAVPAGALASIMTAPAVESEWAARGRFDSLDPFEQASRIACSRRGLGVSGARFLASSGRLAEDHSGAPMILPSSLTHVRALVHTRLVRRSKRRIGEERLAVDVRVDKSVRTLQHVAFIENMIAVRVISLSVPIELYGGRRASKARARIEGGGDGSSYWGDAAQDAMVAQALTFVDRMWTDHCVHGLGMRAAIRGKFSYATRG